MANLSIYGVGAWPMQDDAGLKRMLGLPSIYELFQTLVGAKRSRQWRADNCWKFHSGEKIVDIGCGPGVMVDYLPPAATFLGIDINPDYIHQARRRYGDRGQFLVGTVDDFVDDSRFASADVVTCNGLLHHLDDEAALNVLRFAKRILKPSGRLVCVEPVFLLHQGTLSKWIMSRDRGRAIRDEQQWKQLVSQVFCQFSTSIMTGLIRIPYVHIYIECQKETNSSQ
jgi:ubiquinone/menaquinone biosynthesis C-methylase UbiE